MFNPENNPLLVRVYECLCVCVCGVHVHVSVSLDRKPCVSMETVSST